MISKAFTLFCRKFGNVVNHAFLALIFWGIKFGWCYIFCFLQLWSHLKRDFVRKKEPGSHWITRYTRITRIWTAKKGPSVLPIYSDLFCPQLHWRYCCYIGASVVTPLGRGRKKSLALVRTSRVVVGIYNVKSYWWSPRGIFSKQIHSICMAIRVCPRVA